eukprot:851236-Amphidinium_carterae.1
MHPANATSAILTKDSTAQESQLREIGWRLGLNVHSGCIATEGSNNVCVAVCTPSTQPHALCPSSSSYRGSFNNRKAQ